mmetsp:Transcript_12088/g.33496  ORF Transcript_12088/g.33496 Transcript_12088/m.33496 type:complete len:228 (-) Transcript_12088:451-1134(-)
MAQQELEEVLPRKRGGQVHRGDAGVVDATCVRAALQEHLRNPNVPILHAAVQRLLPTVVPGPHVASFVQKKLAHAGEASPASNVQGGAPVGPLWAVHVRPRLIDQVLCDGGPIRCRAHVQRGSPLRNVEGCPRDAHHLMHLVSVPRARDIGVREVDLCPVVQQGSHARHVPLVHRQVEGSQSLRVVNVRVRPPLDEQVDKVAVPERGAEVQRSRLDVVYVVYVDSEG